MLSITKSRYNGKRLQIFFVVLFSLVFSLTILAQMNYEKSKPTMEKGKLIIKVKEGIGPLEKQEGTVSFGIPSLDQKVSMYEVNKLEKMFIHKPIPKNSGLPDLSRIYQIEFPEKYNVVIAAKAFSKDANIEYAEPVPIIYLAHEPNDPLFVQQWYLNQIQAPLAWDIHKGEEGDSVVILSITDTGCRYQHPDIGQNIWQNLGEDANNNGSTIIWNGTNWVLDPGDLNGIDDDGNGFVDDLIGWNFVNNNYNPTDANGHGTAVSGLAGATTNNLLGIASISYNLKVMPVQALNAQGSGTLANLYNSLIYSAENGADVINCSWGGSTYSNANKEVVEYVNSLGSIIVAAAGNSNSTEPLFPACYPYVIGVAAIDSQNVRTPYSSYGAGVDISAPGPQTFQPFITLNINDGYGNVTFGTSFSSPIITGMAGLIKSFRPTWSTDEIIKQLLYTTDNIDPINPGFEHLLGTGKVNAYHALADSEITITPELKIGLTLLVNSVSEYSKPLFPDSVMNFSLRVQNYSHFLDANPVIITLTSNNPDIQIIDGNYTGLLEANSIVDLLDEFQIQISPGAPTAIATLSFNVTANLPVVAGSVLELKVIVNPQGILVWEGIENGQDFSGEYIKNYLASNSYNYIYTTESFLSYKGLDAIFLSFGNYGSGLGTSIAFDNYHAAIVQEYLEGGGKVYIEGGDPLGYDQAGNTVLLNLFGLASASDGGTNSINGLQGQTASLTEGMLFTASTQVNNTWIDIYTPNSFGKIAFIESGYGNVGVESTGSIGQKTFCFSYALAELVDGNPPSTRNILLEKILEFFDVIIPVELTSFTATSNGKEVLLSWTTATELNNLGFEVQRSADQKDFFTVGFVNGHGTTTEPQSYTFTDKNLSNGKNYYRLKQVDYDGSYEYSNVIEVDWRAFDTYLLEQNYPNPFNPTTTIGYGIKEKGNVKITILNAIGEEVAVIVNEEKESGYHQIGFNAATLPSGVYFYQLRAGEYVSTKKMILLK